MSANVRHSTENNEFATPEEREVLRLAAKWLLTEEDIHAPQMVVDETLACCKR